MKKQKHFIWAVLILILIIPLGFYTKIYSGAGHVWINNKLGGVFYEIFWCILFFILLPKSKPKHIAIGVFAFTCLIEFMQLLDSSFLVFLRSNFIGRTIIGSSFSWTDFPYYIIGSVLGFLLLNKLKK